MDIPIISTDISEGYMPKNLVVCCDGTNNEIAGDATNVLRLDRMLVRDSEQVAFYDSGVGTIASPDRVTSHSRMTSSYSSSRARGKTTTSASSWTFNLVQAATASR